MISLTLVCRRTCTGWGVWRRTWPPPGWTWHTGSSPPCPSWEGPENGPHLRNTHRAECHRHKQNGLSVFLFFFCFYCLLEKKEKKKEEIKGIAIQPVCHPGFVPALIYKLRVWFSCETVKTKRNYQMCVLLLDAAKYIFVKSCCRAGNCQLFEVLFRRIHGENQFQVPLSLPKKGKEKRKRKSCHLRPIRKPLISCTFHVEASFG